MKQYVVINNILGMSKGKIARVCFTAGLNQYRTVGFFKRIKWMLLGQKAIITKTDDIESLLNWLNSMKIKYVVHKDAGLTQVPKGSICMVSFFVEKDNDYLKQLKLL